VTAGRGSHECRWEEGIGCIRRRRRQGRRGNPGTKSLRRPAATGYPGNRRDRRRAGGEAAPPPPGAGGCARARSHRHPVGQQRLPAARQRPAFHRPDVEGQPLLSHVPARLSGLGQCLERLYRSLRSRRRVQGAGPFRRRALDRCHGADQHPVGQSGGAQADSRFRRGQPVRGGEEPSRRPRRQPGHARPGRQERVRARQEPGPDTRRRRLQERRARADPIHSGDARGAWATADDRAAADQQILHIRSGAGQEHH
jgi:hypothetical protein